MNKFENTPSKKVLPQCVLKLVQNIVRTEFWWEKLTNFGVIAWCTTVCKFYDSLANKVFATVCYRKASKQDKVRLQL